MSVRSKFYPYVSFFYPYCSFSYPYVSFFLSLLLCLFYVDAAEPCFAGFRSFQGGVSEYPTLKRTDFNRPAGCFGDDMPVKDVILFAELLYGFGVVVVSLHDGDRCVYVRFIRILFLLLRVDKYELCNRKDIRISLHSLLGISPLRCRKFR